MCETKKDHWKCNHVTVKSFTPCTRIMNRYKCTEESTPTYEHDVMCSSCRFQEEADKKAAEEKARGGFAEDFSQLDLMEE